MSYAKVINGVIQEISMYRGDGDNWYDFIPAVNEPPAGQIADGERLEIDAQARTVSRFLVYRDMTTDELKDRSNALVNDQIEYLQREASKRDATGTMTSDWQAANDARLADLQGQLR